MEQSKDEKDSDDQRRTRVELEARIEEFLRNGGRIDVFEADGRRGRISIGTLDEEHTGHQRQIDNGPLRGRRSGHFHTRG